LTGGGTSIYRTVGGVDNKTITIESLHGEIIDNISLKLYYYNVWTGYSVAASSGDVSSWNYDAYEDLVITNINATSVTLSRVGSGQQTGYVMFEKVTINNSDEPQPQPTVVIGDPNDADQVTDFLDTHDGHTVPDLTINRPVVNNMYNTLCLPFNMDADQIAASSLNGVEIYEFVDADVTNDELYLYTSEQKHEIVAGRPYLVKFSAASQLDDLDFVNVTINNANLDDQAVTIKGVTFKGTFQPIVLGAQGGLNFNGGHLFLAANNTLYWPNTNNKLKGFRAYFLVSGSVAPHGAPARVVVRPKTPTAIENVNVNAKAVKLLRDGQLFIIKNGVKYNAQGQEIEN
jgi:hypothetical protein